MHDHRLDGMLQFDHQGVTARALRLHLDNSHDAQTRGWDYAGQCELHHKLHAEETERLAGIEAAGNLLAERLAAAPAPVVEAVLSDTSLYLTDANGTVYLAESYGALGWADGDDFPLYRLTPQPAEVPIPAVPDLMVALEESLAAAKRTLGEKERA